MLSKIAAKYRSPSSYAQFRSSKLKKKLMYGLFFFFGLEFYSRAEINTKLRFKGIMTEDNIAAIKNCKSLRHVD